MTGLAFIFVGALINAVGAAVALLAWDLLGTIRVLYDYLGFVDLPKVALLILEVCFIVAAWVTGVSFIIHGVRT